MSLTTVLCLSLVTRTQGHSPFLFFSDPAPGPGGFWRQPRGGWSPPVLSVVPRPSSWRASFGPCGGAAPWCLRAAPPGPPPERLAFVRNGPGILPRRQDQHLTDSGHTLMSGQLGPGTCMISVSPAAWAGTVALPENGGDKGEGTSPQSRPADPCVRGRVESAPASRAWGSVGTSVASAPHSLGITQEGLHVGCPKTLPCSLPSEVRGFRLGELQPF